jgi:transcription-repair coupling factor (superfamily II helicase)
LDLNLAGLLPLLRERPEFRAVCEQLEQAARSRQRGSRLNLSGLSAPVRPYFLATLQSCIGRPLLVLTARPVQARELAHSSAAYSAQPELVLSWPTPDTLPYERIGQDPAITSGRLETLAALRHLDPAQSNRLLIFASAKGLMQPTLSKTDFRQSVITLKRGQIIELNGLLEQFIRLGYSAESLVEQPGQFSRRGGIVDFFPLTSEMPVRLELFDDEIDSLRYFDPVTQRSSQKTEEITLTPPVEVPLWRSAQAYDRLAGVDRSGLREEVREEWERLLSRIENGEQFEGIEQFMPYYTGGEAMCSLLDHLPAEAVVVLDGPAQINFAVEELTAQAEELRAEFEKDGEIPAGIIRPYLNWTELEAEFNHYPRLLLNRTDEMEDKLGEAPLVTAIQALPGENIPVELFGPVSEFAGQIPRVIQTVDSFLKEGHRIVVVTQQAE